MCIGLPCHIEASESAQCRRCGRYVTSFIYILSSAFLFSGSGEEIDMRPRILTFHS